MTTTMTSAKEEFKDCPFAPQYKVGNFGTVLNPDGKPLKKIMHHGGCIIPYVKYGFRMTEGQRFYKADVLIAELWIEKPTSADLISIIPKDDDIYNLRADNLQWVSRKEKIAFSKRVGHKYQQQDIIGEPSRNNEYGGAF